MTRLQPVHLARRRALWLHDALASEPDAEQLTPLQGAERADVCIVGGGYTGLWTALRIKELDPSVDVVLLEADLCGSGASGRNGGFVLGWWGKLASLSAVCGDEEGMRLARAAAQAVVEIGEFCAINHIDAHFRQAGYIWATTTPLRVGIWDQGLRYLQSRGVDAVQALTPTEVAARTGSPVHVAGMLDTSGATAQPALLARGLRRVALTRGVRIYERSPVTRLDSGGRPVVHTAGGAVAAEKVILAINAWAATLPGLRNAILPMSSDMVATAPIPERLAAIGWTGGEAISDSRLMLHYYQATRDGRVVIGRGGAAHALLGRVTSTFDHDPERTAAVIQGLHRLYPMLADVPVTHEWSGAVDRAENGLPFFGRLGGDPRILYGVGYSGTGVTQAKLGGRILASTALERHDEWSTTALNRGPRSAFPPDPIRYVGGILVRGAVERQEATEETGQRAGFLTRLLAGFAPSGMRKGKGQSDAKTR